jgi:predicted alpha/beta hydrolase family esterase
MGAAGRPDAKSPPDRADEALRECTSRYDLVLVPGRYNSGPEHWQSIWERELPLWKRIDQRDWIDPDIRRWVGSLGRLLAHSRRPALLAGHSLGALASCRAAVEMRERVAGLLLVAPAEPSLFDAQDSVPTHLLAVPSLLVASRNDPFMGMDRAEHWASAWGSELVDLGDAGHINAESGFGPWRFGRELMARLVALADARAEPLRE